MIFSGNQTVFTAGIPGDLSGGVNGGDFFGGGTFASILDAGSYRFFATSSSRWGTRAREGGPGETLSLDLRFARPIPEPSAALAFGVGTLVVALAQRRSRG